MTVLSIKKISGLFMIIAICLGFLGPQAVADGSAIEKHNDTWEWFPDTGRAFPVLKADPRAAMFRFGFLYEKNGDWLEDASIGGDLGFLSKEYENQDRISLTARGLFTARFDFASESFDLQNMDFIGGVALGYNADPFACEFYIYHQSSHLGDEILDRQERSRIDYARETIRLMGSYEYKKIRFYGGPSFTFHAEPESIQNKFLFQAGFERPFSLWGRPMYAALDLQSRQEHDWSVNVSAQIGFGLGNAQKKMNRQWVFLEIYDGYSNMGQFYDLRDRYGLIGVSYCFR